MPYNENLSGTYVGIWEGIHKAFKTIDKSFDFDAKCIILEKSANNLMPRYFIKEKSINTQAIPIYKSDLPAIYETICKTLNITTPYPNLNNPNILAQDFISTIEKLVQNLTNRKAYFLELLNDTQGGKIIYAIIVFENHNDLPNFPENKIILNQLNSIQDMINWERSPLIHALFLISIIELRDKWLQFTRNSSISALSHFTEKELLHRAGSLLLNVLVTQHISPDGISSDTISISADDSTSLNYFYSNLDAISRIGYEKREPRAVLLVSNSKELKSNKLNLSIRFSSPIPLSKHKAARKIIEMGGDDRFILTDGIELYGIGIKSSLPQNFIKIAFEGFDQWQVDYKQEPKEQKTLFRSKHGIPHIPRPLLSNPDFQKQIEAKYPPNELTTDNINKIYTIIEEAMKNASHGALVVVCNQAKDEAKRLSNQATQLKTPTDLTNDVLKGIFSIDGAILLDAQGMCHAIGAILDGQADNQPQTSIQSKEDPSRGSRYNSSVRYVNTLRRRPDVSVAAIVISEDGQINVV